MEIDSKIKTYLNYLLLNDPKSRNITKNIKSFRQDKQNVQLSIQLTWMFFSRRATFLLNNVHKWSLRVIYDDHSSSYSELLIEPMNDPQVRLYHRFGIICQHNVKICLKEIYKLKNSISLSLTDIMFQAWKNNFKKKSPKNCKWWKTLGESPEILSYRAI